MAETTFERDEDGDPEDLPPRSRGGGRKGEGPIYDKKFPKIAAKLAELGATDADLADAFGVSIMAVKQWKTKYEDFLKALQVGKTVPDDRVERSLLERALGYTYDTEKIFCGKDGHVTRVKTREHCPPEVVAQIFWLKNRRPDVWRAQGMGAVGDDGPFEIIVRGGLPQKQKGTEKS